MTTLATLHDLMLHELKDLYSAERQLVQALPKMEEKATSTELRKAIHTHLGQTENHVTRLEKAFEMLGVTPKAQKCKAMEGIIAEGKDLIDEDMDPEVLDAGIIASAQRVEHYEIAAYGTVREFARGMGHDDLADLLTQTLDEEKNADQLLTTLAESGINALANRDEDMQPVGAHSNGGRSTSASATTSGSRSRRK